MASPMPEGLRLPDVIITRRTRTISMSGRIEDEVRQGTVKFFCRSRGHGFIDDDEARVSQTKTGFNPFHVVPVFFLPSSLFSNYNIIP
jgi:hypothetical protein